MQSEMAYIRRTGKPVSWPNIKVSKTLVRPLVRLPEQIASPEFARSKRSRKFLVDQSHDFKPVEMKAIWSRYEDESRQAADIVYASGTCADEREYLGSHLVGQTG